MLTWEDNVVFGLVLAISGSIGLYFRCTGGKQATVKEYALADRSMSPWPVAFSLMASYMSAITLLGVTSENYKYGTQFMFINLGYVFGTPIIIFIYLPVFYNRGGTSAYAYLEARFGKPTRIAASLAFTLQMILYNAIVLYAPSLAISAVTGLNQVLAVLSVGIVCTFYSTIGGMRAVLITHVFQSILMFASVYIVIINGIVTIGFTEVFRRAHAGGRIELFNFDLDPTVRHTVWSQSIGGMFVFVSLFGSNQAQVQRLLTVRDLKSSGQILWICLPSMCFLSLSTGWAALTVYAGQHGCDPLSTGRICHADQLLPQYVDDELHDYHGITGLFIAGILSASLSTLSSSINSLAIVTLEDYIKPCIKTRTLSLSKAAFISKCLVVMFGALSIGFSFLVEYMDGISEAALVAFGVVGGPLLALFTLGMVFPFVGQKSALPAFIISLVLALVIGVGRPKPPSPVLGMRVDLCNSSIIYPACGGSNTTPLIPMRSSDYFWLFRLSYMWYTPIGFTVAVVLACFGALLYPETRQLDDSVFSPIIRRILEAQREIASSVRESEVVVPVKSTNELEIYDGESLPNSKIQMIFSEHPSRDIVASPEKK